MRSARQVQVKGLVVGGQPYLWSPDGARVIFQDSGGVWALSPDGEVGERMASGFAYRELVGWTAAGGLLFLEARPEGLAVLEGQPGLEPRLVTTLAESQVGSPGRPLWRHLAGNRLVVAAEGLPVWKVDVGTGAVERLTATTLPVHYGSFAVAPDSSALAFKGSIRTDPVRLLDLESGALLEPDEGGTHLGAVSWSPALSSGSLWAVRVAASGSNLPVAVGVGAVEGATHIAVGDATGRVHHLKPPEPLQLVAGPLWSPDGRWLAVTGGLVRGVGSGEPSDLRPTSVWLIEVESGQWQKAGDLAEGWVAGWHPDARHLLVQIGFTRLERWPLDGGPVHAEPHPWRPADTAALPDGSLVSVSLAPPHPVILLRGQEGPVPILDLPGHKSDLTVRGGYAGVVRLPDGDRPELVLIRLP